MGEKKGAARLTGTLQSEAAVEMDDVVKLRFSSSLLCHQAAPEAHYEYKC